MTQSDPDLRAILGSGSLIRDTEINTKMITLNSVASSGEALKLKALGQCQTEEGMFTREGLSHTLLPIFVTAAAAFFLSPFSLG